MTGYGTSDSLQAEEAGGILPGHDVDLGLVEARFCEDRQSHLKGLGVVHPAGLAEIGAYYDVCRAERSNVGKLLRPVVHHRVLRINDLRPSTREALPAQHD